MRPPAYALVIEKTDLRSGCAKTTASGVSKAWSCPSKPAVPRFSFFDLIVDFCNAGCFATN